MAVGFHGLLDGTGLAFGVVAPIVVPPGVSAPPDGCALDPGTPAWLLDLDIGGRELRYATRDAYVADAAGVCRWYRRGLSDFPMRLDGMEFEAGVEVVDREINWAELAARGDGLERQPGILRFWAGGLLEQARIVVDGLLQSPEYGTPDNPSALVATLRDPSTEVLYPSVSSVVDETTFEYDTAAPVVFDDLIAGAVYPTVFGYPGGAALATPFPTTPALFVHSTGGFSSGPGNGHLMIALGEVDATEVWVYEFGQIRSLIGPAITPGTDAFFQLLPVQTFTDLLGRKYSGVEFNPTTDPVTDLPPWDIYPLPGEQYYVGWSRDGGGGGNLRPDRTGPIRTLTDVALFVLRHSGERVDLQAMEAQGNLLDGYLIDGCINQRLGLLRWFEEQIVPLFPIVRARSNRGLFFRHVNWRATRVDAIMSLSTATGRVTRTSGIRSSEAVANVFTIEFQLKQPGGLYRKRAVLSHSETTTPLGFDERVTVAPILARSFAKYREIEKAPVQCGWTWSEATAQRILTYWAHRDALPRRFVEYAGPDLHRLHRGDIVTITDPELSLAEAVAVVDGVTLSAGRLHRVALEVIDLQFRSTV